MKIALCADGRSPHTQRWADEMARREHDVTVVWQVHHLDVAAIGQYVPEVHHVACVRGMGWRARGGAGLERVPSRDLRTRLQPDLVQGMYLVESGWTAAQMGRPLVQFALGSDVKSLEVRPSSNPRRMLGDSYRWWRTIRAVRAADAVLCDSERIRTLLRERSPLSRVELVRIGVERDKPDRRRDWRRELGIGPQSLLLLSTRLFTHNYNITTIIRAMAHVIQAVPDAVLVLKELPRLGDSRYRDECHHLVDQLRIGHAVRFVGELDRPDLLSLYRASDVYLSVPTSDATAVSVLEAMSCGVPVVASETAGIDPQVLDDGRTAMLVPPGDAEELTNAILRLRSDPELVQKLTAEAARLVGAIGDLKREFDKVEELYVELVGHG